MLPLVQQEFSLSGAGAGLYTSFYFASATIIAVFSGRIVDRIGARMGLALGVGTVGIMMILHALSPVYALVLGLAFLTGIGFSLVTPSVSKGVIEFVGPERRAGSMGLVHGFGGVGALFGTALMPLLGELFGWRRVLSGSAVAALLISAFILVGYRRISAGPVTANRPSAPAGHEQKSGSEQNSGSIGRDLLTILGDRALLSICVIGVVFGVSLASVTGHMSLFLTADLGYSPAVGGVGLAWFHIGGILGQPGWGYLNDRFFGGRRRRGLILLSFLTSGMSLFFALVVSAGYLPLVALFFVCGVLGFIVLGMPGLYFTSISELVPAGLTGLATGVALVFSRLGVVVAAPLFGLFSDISGSYTLSWVVLAGFAFLVAVFVSLIGGVTAPKTETARETAKAE